MPNRVHLVERNLQLLVDKMFLADSASEPDDWEVHGLPCINELLCDLEKLREANKLHLPIWLSLQQHYEAMRDDVLSRGLSSEYFHFEMREMC